MRCIPLWCWLVLQLLWHAAVWGQEYTVSGKVVDAKTREPLAFVHLIVNDGKQGDVTDIDGKFSLFHSRPITSLTISYVGYNTLHYLVQGKTTGILIQLQPSWIELSEVEITPGENPAHRIINHAIDNRDLNDPSKLASFSYTSYDKMYFTIENDSLFLLDTTVMDKGSAELKSFLEERYFFLMETVSEKKFLFPDHRYDQVIASRISGFKDPIIVFMISQLQSTSFYDDIIRIADKNYINPVTKSSLRNYLFILQDTIYHPEPADTTFVIYYRPFLKSNFDGLEGLLYIHTHRWAIENVIAEPARKDRGISIRIQQKYERVDGEHWFPVQLNTDLVLTNVSASTDSASFPLTGIGKSYIRDIRINPELDRSEFSPAEIEVMPDAYARAEEYLYPYRIDTLSIKEINTYRYIDSIGKEHHFDEMAKSFETVMNGRIPWGIIDFDLRKVLRYNDYEGFYFGLGIQTNEKLSRLFSVGGHLGYGFRDRHLKYGGNVSLMISRNAELSLALRYLNDVSEPGGTHFFDDYEKFSYDHYRDPLLMRMDRLEAAEISAGIRSLSYLKTVVSFRNSYKEPGYEYYYGFQQGDVMPLSNAFRFTEASISFRYAYKEKFMKNVRTKVSLGTTWPVVWLTYTLGMEDVMGGEYAFNRIDLKIEESFFIKYLGETNLMLRAGYIDTPLPYTNLYTGNGSYHAFTIYAPHSFATARLNEFLMDRYIAFYFSHNFGKLLIRKKGFAPEVEITTNIGYGKLQHPGYHHKITFTTMEKGFYESGLNMHRLVNVDGIIALGVGVHYRYGPYHLERELDNFAFKFTLIVPMLSDLF